VRARSSVVAARRSLMRAALIRVCSAADDAEPHPDNEVPGRRTPLGARPLEAAKIGARGYCGPAVTVYARAARPAVVSKMQENCTASTQASPETRPPRRRSPAFSTMRRGRRNGRGALLERVVAREARTHGELLGDGREAGGA